MVITSIKQQKDKTRLNIYLDGKFGFGLDLEDFVKLGLKVDQELTHEEIDNIKGVADLQKISDKLINFATIRPRSEKEVKDWFRRKKTPEELTDKLLDRLKSLELLDDEKFTVWWIDQRLQFRPKSKRELQQELMMKGIGKNLIEEVLSKTDINEVRIATKLLEKRLYKWQKLDKKIARRKMVEFLTRKGFGWDMINRTIDALEGK